MSTQKMDREVLNFFREQGCVVVSTIDSSGSIHSSCKGIVEIDEQGRVCLFDLYQARTLHNLTHNSHITLTAVNEHSFQGYALKGVARILKKDEVDEHTHKAWAAHIAGRLTRRVVKNIKDEKGHTKHPEILMPDPAYVILMEVSEVIDLRPHHLRE